MSDYLTDFVQESEERITELNNALLTLERDPDDEEAMENIFRIAHTLKGNCGAMGLESASDLAHAIEDLLDAVRGDDLEVTPELMDVVFDAVDELETMVDEVAATGEIETDPSATIEALRTHLSDASGTPAGITTPTSAEIDDVCSRFAPPADDAHDAYLARLAITQEAGINNGELVVDALIDAFDLIGTVPSRETIETGEYGGRFDAVFGTAVGEAAIASGLEPVEEVDDFEIVDVSDRFEAAGEGPAQPPADAEPGDELSSDEAQDLEVDDLLDEFDEFDNLDEMVEDVEAEELDAFEDMGEAGSFDDLLDEEDVAELDAEPGEPPADSLEEDDDGPTTEPPAAAEPATDDAASEPVEEDVDDAGAVFDELKDEVEMVGFDELQDELEELEFDEFDDEEEVDMDELLGDDADDDSFLDDAEPSEDAVDDILVDADSDDGSSADDVGTPAADEPTADTDANDPFSSTDDLDGAVDAFADDDVAAATDVERTASSDDTLEADASATPDDSRAVDSEPDPPSDGTADSEPDLPSAGAADATDLEGDAADDSTVDEGLDADEAALDAEADEAVFDETVTTEADGAVEEHPDETVAAEDVAVESDADEGIGDTPAEGDDGSAASADPADAFPAGETEPVDGASVGDDTGDVADETDDVTDDTADADPFDAGETDSVDETAEPVADDGIESVDATPATDPETDDAAATGESDDDGATESFGDAGDAFEPTAAFDDDFGAADDERDPFADDDFAVDADDSFDDFSTDPDEPEAESDDFETGFDESLDDEAFAGTGEFDVGDAGFDSPASASETDSDSSLPSAASFGDDGADSDTDDDVVRIIDEPEIEIPDISLPETSDRPDADDETDEIQSVRVDVEQIDSLLTLVEGLVTSRVRLRHAADANDEGDALETELDALSDLTTDLQETVMDIRLVPLQTVTNRLPRVVRDIARDQDKDVAFEMSGEHVELDRSILDRIGDPLIHLVRNAVDHGIESPDRREEVGKPREGAVEVHADRSRDRVTITVEDDGSGLDPDRLRSEAVEAGILDESAADSMSDAAAYDLIFHPGLSTADEVTDVSGRGVGMDVVKRTVEDLDGTVSIDSDEGEGTTVTMTLPVTVAIDEILFVESGGEEFGIPTKAVQDIESAASIEPPAGAGESVLRGDDGDYPVVRLADVLETPAPGSNGEGMVVRIRDEVREVALHCDHVQGQQEVVVKPFEGVMSGIPGLSGATVRGRGEVVNILDVTTL